MSFYVIFSVYQTIVVFVSSQDQNTRLTRFGENRSRR